MTSAITPPEWYTKLDLDEFKKDVDNLRKTLEAQQGPEDMAHLRKIVFVTNSLRYIGYAFMWLPWYYGFHILSLSTAIFAEFAICNHHIIHSGYDYAKDPKFNKKSFTDDSLWGRWKSWSLEVFLPTAWANSHNQIHHYSLGEDTDPDLVERNLAFLRKMKAPNWFKSIPVFFMAAMWKWYYYSSNNTKRLSLNKLRSSDSEQYDKIPLKVKNAPFTLPTYISKYRPWMMPLTPIISPYFVLHFLFFPLFFSAIGWAPFVRVFVNMALMDVATNLHAFTCIVTNHAGDDLYRFSTPTSIKSGDFYMRQVIGSADYTSYGEITDYLLGGLLWQQAHHCFPDLTYTSYQKGSPLLYEICKKHGVPSVRENVFKRLIKTVDIMTGKTSMIRFN